MKSKTILFRYPGPAGPHACTDGEIESTVNVRLIPTSSSYVADEDTSSNLPITDATIPSDILLELNRISSDILPIAEFSILPTALPGWQNHPANPPSISVEAPKVRDMEGWTGRASETLRKFNSVVARHHLFTEPLFVLSALRLKGGRHFLPSSPVLLIPNSIAPAVDGADNLSLDSMTMTIRNAVCHRLRLRLTIPATLLNYKDYIEGVDIFISSPIPLYDKESTLSPIHRASGTEAPLSWLTESLTDSEFSARLLSVTSFRAISAIPLSDASADWQDISFNIPDFSLIPVFAHDSRVKELIEYTPDYFQHHGISAGTGCTYADVTTLTDLTLTLPVPPPLPAMIPSAEEISSSGVGELSYVALETESVKNGNVLHAYAYSPAWPQAILSESSFPKWIFIPDADARQLSLITTEGAYIIPLQRHPFLKGAIFWWGTLRGGSISQAGVQKIMASVNLPTEKTVSRDSLSQPGTLRISDSIFTFTTSELSRLSRAPVMIAPVDPALPVEVVTRPLKLSSLLPQNNISATPSSIGLHTDTYAGSAKRSTSRNGIANSMSNTLSGIWELRLIGAFSGSPRLSFHVSHDLVNWQLLLSSKASLLRLPPLSYISGKPLFLAPTSTSPLHFPCYGRLTISGYITGYIEALFINYEF